MGSKNATKGIGTQLSTSIIRGEPLERTRDEQSQPRVENPIGVQGIK